MTGYSPPRVHRITPNRQDHYLRRYLLVRNPKTLEVVIIDTSTRHGREAFDRHVLDNDEDMVGTIESSLPFDDLIAGLARMKT